MWKTAITSLISAILGGLLVFLAMSATLPENIDGSRNSGGKVATRSSTTQRQAGELTAGEIYKEYGPSVVHIKSVFTTARRDFFGFVIPEQQSEADGSGFIVDKSGIIVTNAHVVQGSNATASRITVFLSDNEEVQAKLLGTDPGTDLAVLKIDPGKRDLRVVKLGDSSKISVGDKVYAIGSPFDLDGTMTEGIISALNRTIDSPDPSFKIRGAIQTDAAVNPGNSGGPLFNSFGEVIGINSQIVDPTNSGNFAGIAFAIPSNTVKKVAKQIEEKGHASHPWIGISGIKVSKELADFIKLPVDKGVMIGQVIPDSPAVKAGLKGGNQQLVNSQTGYSIIVGGDIITKIDGTDVETMEDVINIVEEHKVGDKIKLEIYRGDKKITKTLILGERPQSTSE